MKGVRNMNKGAAPAAPPMDMPPLHFATDYRPKCASNIPVGQQEVTRSWLMKNADEIIALSRKRQERRVMDLKYEPLSPVEGPGQEKVIACNTDACQIERTGVSGGIGIYRPTGLPELTNTWTSAYLMRDGGGSATMGRQEGGRNTGRTGRGTAI